MKIGYILGEFPSISETFILREILALRESGAEIAIFALRPGASGKVHAQAAALRGQTKYARRLSDPGLWRSQGYFLCHRPLLYLTSLFRIFRHYWRCPWYLLGVLHRFPAAVDFAYQARSLDLTRLHAHFAFLPADVGLIMAGLLRLPCSLAVHARDLYAQPARRLAPKFQAADLIVTCTEANREYLRRQFPRLEPARFRMIRHGLDLQKWTPLPSRPTHPPLILAVGRLVPKKGFIHLIEAAHLLAVQSVSCRWIIVGDGPQRMALAALIAKHNLAAVVQLAGTLTQEELRPLYAQATLVAAPAVIAPDGDRDGIPNVLLEAMALGIPVIATPVSGIPEVVSDGITGVLAPPGDSAALAEKIRRLLVDEALCHRLAAAARQHLINAYDLRRNTAALRADWEPGSSSGQMQS